MWKATIPASCLSVRMAPRGWIFIKFHIWRFFKICWEIQVWLKSYKTKGYFLHCMQEYSWSFSRNFYKLSRDRVWQSCISLDGSTQTQPGLSFILKVLGVFTNSFQQFLRFTATGITVWFFVKVSWWSEWWNMWNYLHFSNVTASLMAVPLWQQQLCIRLFWTKSVLHLIRIISITKLITSSKALFDIFPILLFQLFLFCVRSFASWTANCIISMWLLFLKSRA